MTEKRFHYNTFYHADDMSRVLEYEIIDRQSYPNYPHHDEKEDVPNWYIYIGENDSGWQDMLVKLLNELHEENKQLKEFKEDVFNKIDMHLRMLPTARDNEFNEEDGDPSLYSGAIYMLETLKKELME